MDIRRANSADLNALNALEQQLFDGDRISPRQMKRFYIPTMRRYSWQMPATSWRDMHCFYFIKVHSYQDCIRLP